MNETLNKEDRKHLMKVHFSAFLRKYWNYFDVLLGITGITDVMAQILRQDNTAASPSLVLEGYNI